MLSPFVCGTGTFNQEDDIDELLSPCTTPKRSKRSSRDSKNPYANRGLDKFCAVLAELENKKQKIYTQKGSEDISFVRFVYSSSNDWKPIVVKARDRKQEQGHQTNVKDKQGMQNSEAQDKHTIEASASIDGVQQPNAKLSQKPQKEGGIKWRFKMEKLRQPSYYLPVMVVLILLFLIMYGRSFAVLCTSLGWYLVPMIKEKSSVSKKPKRKKEYSRGLSEKINMVNDGSSSPKSVLSGPADNSSAQHAHRKSW